MNDVMNRNNDENNSLQKLLKGLPKVKSSSDFEARLQRRIAQEVPQQQKENVFVKIFFGRRTPAFAYSLIAIVAIGVLSYYVFFRAGVAPTVQSKKMTPVEEKNITSPQSMRAEAQKEKTFDKKESIIHEPQGKPNSPTKDRNLHQTHRPKDFKQSTAPETKYEQLPAADEMGKASGEAIQNEIQQKVVPMQSQPISVSKSAGAFSAQHALTSGPDSISLADSLKLDSIQRVQKRLQILQQREKTKKPFK